MGNRLQDKVAIVVGAGQTPGESVGTGRAITIRFIQEGARVMAVDRYVASAQETLALAGEGAASSCVFEADVTKSEDLERMATAAIERWGRIDILVYNVGVSVGAGDTALDGMTDEIFDRVTTINLRGAVMSAKYVVPYMREQESGVVINIASMSAYETTRANVAYRTSKAGMIAFTQQLAIQNASHGIRANAVLPGLIDTPLSVDQRVQLLNVPREQLVASRNSEVPLRGGMGTAWDVASATLFLASDEAKFTTGASLPVEGGMLMRIGF